MKRLIIIFFSVYTSLSLTAAPARRGWVERPADNGTSMQVWTLGDEFAHIYMNRSGKQVDQLPNGLWHEIGDMPSVEQFLQLRANSPMKRTASATPRTAKYPQKGLIILVNFADTIFKPGDTQQAMDSLANGAAYHYAGATGSARQYFMDQSKGKYCPEFDVVGPVTISRKVAYYGTDKGSEGNDQYAGDMVVEACHVADTLFGVDFTKYDMDGDKKVDFVFILYAGCGQADGGPATSIWPHAWTIPEARNAGRCTFSEAQCQVDGLKLNRYACSAEINAYTLERCGIGTICHEFGHVLGMADYYDTNGGVNWDYWITPSYWSIMDQGCYANEGLTPPNYCVFDRCFMGWDTAQVLTLSSAVTDTIIPLNNPNSKGYVITQGNAWISPFTEQQCYYVENRQWTGWDEYTPGHGLVIWTVNYKASAWNGNMPNNTAYQPRITVVSASGEKTDIGHQEYGTVLGLRDPFPGALQVPQYTLYTNQTLWQITETQQGDVTFIYAPSVPTNIESVESASTDAKKVYRDGKLWIEKSGKLYDMLGAVR